MANKTGRLKFAFVFFILLLFSNLCNATNFHLMPQYPRILHMSDYSEIDIIDESGTLHTQAVIEFYLDENYLQYNEGVEVYLSAYEYLPHGRAQNIHIKMCEGYKQGINFDYTFDLNCDKIIEFEDYEISENKYFYERPTHKWAYSHQSLKPSAYHVFVSYDLPNFVWNLGGARWWQILSSTNEIKFRDGCNIMFCHPDARTDRIVLIPTTYKILSSEPEADEEGYISSGYIKLEFEGKNDIRLVLENLFTTTFLIPLLWAIVGALASVIIATILRGIYNRLRVKEKVKKMYSKAIKEMEKQIPKE